MMTNKSNISSSSRNNNQNDENETDDSIVMTLNKNKQVVFLRHSVTFMNEYLGQVRFGAPNFSDIFDDETRGKFLDTPLSPWGIQLAQETLLHPGPQKLPFLFDKDKDKTEILLDLIVVSPLRRALQTFDIGLKPHLLPALQKQPQRPRVKIVAHPDAAERVYLISDIGRPVSILQQEYPYVDFTSYIAPEQQDQWWWTFPQQQQDCDDDDDDDDYVEWRPMGQGQRYACLGEVWKDFESRMNRFYDFLKNCPEQNILVVCHHGVIDWMLPDEGGNFDNCQWKQVPFDRIRRRRQQPL